MTLFCFMRAEALILQEVFTLEWFSVLKIVVFVQDSRVFETQLQVLHNESNLWTTFGLRSLATTR